MRLSKTPPAAMSPERPPRFAPGLKPAYAAMTRDSSERCEVALDEVTRRLRASAFADPHGIFARDADGKVVIRPPYEWTEAQRVAVKDVRLRDGRVDQVCFHAPMPALNTLARHVGHYEVDNRPTGSRTC